MNGDEIMNMQPGRELDALVAVKVMGGKLRKDGVGEDVWRVKYGYLYPDSFKPSSDISAAWEVVEKVKETHRVDLVIEEGSNYCAILGYGDDNMKIYEAGSKESAPEAICKAALLSLIQEDTP